MPITYTFQRDDCPSFGGASLSRIQTILEIDEFVRSKKDENVSSKIIQKNINHNENDTRSLISVMRKLKLINLIERTEIKASQFYTNNGDAYIHSLRALQELENIRNTIPDAYNATLRGLQLILQEGIWEHYNTAENTRLGIYIILNLIGKTKTLSFNEYCFALSESYINNGIFDFNNITSEIIRNRNNNTVYTFRKIRRTNGIDSEVEDFDSVLQSTREILQQAGILEEGTTDCILKDSRFLIKHNLPYE